MFHLQRIEQRVVQIRGERLFLRLFQHEADHGDADVAVFRLRFGLVDQFGLVEALHRFRQRRLIRIEVVADRRLAAQAGAMRHQHAQRDVFAEAIDGLEIGQIFGDRRVEVERAAFDELHHGQVGEQLRHRADAIDRLRRRRFFGGGIGETVAVRPDDFLIVHQCNRQRRDAFVGHLTLDHFLQRRGDGFVILGGRGVRFRRADSGESGKREHDETRDDPGGWSHNAISYDPYSVVVVRLATLRRSVTRLPTLLRSVANRRCTVPHNGAGADCFRRTVTHHKNALAFQTNV